MGQIKFEEASWEEVLLKGQKEKKLIFLSAYSEWCEPCEEMEEYTYSDLEVTNHFNAQFINVRMDMEDYPGVDLAEQYAIAAFPSYLFLDADGKVVHRGCGSMDAQEFLAMAEEATNDTLCLMAMEARYEAGDRSIDFMMDYLEFLEYACLDAERFAASYLNEVPADQLMGTTAWEVFAAYQWDIYSREFQYFINNQQRFADSLGKRFVDAKLYDTYLAQYQEVFEAEELHDFGMRALLHAIKDVSFTGSDTLGLMMNLHYAEFTENWEDYADHAISLVKMTAMDDPEELNELAWKFYLFVEDKVLLEIASSWAERAVDQQPEPSTIDTYASIQYKLGNRKKAIELEQRALDLASELYDDVSHYEHQLEKFRRK